jgi:murein DD-endopeptidase MepM/ murein hydrolase activator NlpD
MIRGAWCIAILIGLGTLGSGTGAAPPLRDADGLLKPRPLRLGGPKPPWPRRQRASVKLMPLWAQQLRPQELRQFGLTLQERRELGLHPRDLRALGIRPRGQGLIDPTQWPAEPPAPKKLDVARLGRALRRLCPVLIPAKRLGRYAGWMVEFGGHFGVDPTVLAALVYQQSRCIAQKRSSWGLGLAMINRSMHAPRVVKGRYRFWVLDGGAWQPRQLVMDRFAFTRENLQRAEPNLYFAAAIVSVLQQQCPAMDGGFGSVPHRHPVSHFVWGDRVQDAGVEDRVLTARRRLLEYYHGKALPPLGRFEDLPLHCPLDGAPRKITSGLGDDRDGGRRRHTGIDFESYRGEPVHAIAAGAVTLAGVDRGKSRLRPLDPMLTRLVPAARMGPRGLLVTVEHARGLVSSYMHLSAYVVRTGDKVKSGQLIGYVGRTGMKESDAHLHLGLQHDGKHIDPIPHFGPYVFPPSATYLGRNYLARQRERRRLRRRRRRRRCASLPPRARRECRRARGKRPWVGGTTRPPPPPAKRPRRFDPSLRPF